MDGFDMAASRRRAGLLQYEVARKAGVTLHVLVAIERNEVTPSASVQSRILAAITGLAAERAATPNRIHSDVNLPLS